MITVKNIINSLFQHSKLGVVLVDKNLHLQYKNPKIDNFFNGEIESKKIKSLSDLYLYTEFQKNIDSIKKIIDIINKLFKTKKNTYALSLEFIFNNKPHYVKCNFNKVDVNGYLIIIQDISNIKKKEKELRLLNEELKEFSYLISHDLREPANTISSLTELFIVNYGDKINQLGEDAMIYLDYIRKSATRATELTKDLLQYLVINNSENEYKKEFVDFKETVSFVIKNLNSCIESKKDKIEIRYSSDFEKIYCYKSLFISLVQNLLSNAIKFSDNNRKNFIEIEANLLDNGWLIFFKDTGIGIDEIYHKKIFKVFKRLHSRDEIEGTGIGLSICQKIVNLHKGTIEISSEVGVGTTFMVFIPDK